MMFLIMNHGQNPLKPYINKGDLVRTCISIKGILSVSANLSIGDFVRRGFCPDRQIPLIILN